jgi:hypothetical protein
LPTRSRLSIVSFMLFVLDSIAAVLAHLEHGRARRFNGIVFTVVKFQLSEPGPDVWTRPTTGPGPGHRLSAVPVVADGRRGLGTSSGPQRGARAPGAELAAQLAPQCRRRALVDAGHDRAGSWPFSQRPFRSSPIADATRPRQAGPHRGAHAQGAGVGGQLVPQCRRRALVDVRTTGPAPGHRLSAVPVVADCGCGGASPSRAASRRTRPGRRPGRAARAALPASCAGGRGARQGQVVASFSAPFRSWPMAGAAWAHRAGPHREAHALRARNWRGNSRQIAGVVRWWTWHTTGPGPGHRLSAAPVVADGRRGLGTSSRAASRGANAPGAERAGQLAPQGRRRALVDVAPDRAERWPSSQRRSGRGPWPARPGHIESGRIEGRKCSGRGTGRATRAARPASCAGGRGARPG